MYRYLKFVLRNKLDKLNILIQEESMLKDNMNSLISFYIKIRKLLIYINKIKIKGIYINLFKKDRSDREIPRKELARCPIPLDRMFRNIPNRPIMPIQQN